MTLRQLIAITSLVAAALVAPRASAGALADDTYVETVADSIAGGDQAYARGHFGAAYSDYFQAAIRDDARAQELVGFMLLMGPQMFGKGMRQDRAEAVFWFAQAARGGREVAGHMASLLLPPHSARREPGEPALEQ